MRFSFYFTGNLVDLCKDYFLLHQARDVTCNMAPVLFLHLVRSVLHCKVTYDPDEYTLLLLRQTFEQLTNR